MRRSIKSSRLHRLEKVNDASHVTAQISKKSTPQTRLQRDSAPRGSLCPKIKVRNAWAFDPDCVFSIAFYS